VTREAEEEWGSLPWEVANPSLNTDPLRWFPTQHRLHTTRIKKAPPAGGAKGLILMHR
jgi:hypothetical protein